MADAAVPLRADARVLASKEEGGPNRRLVLRVDGWPGAAPGQFAMLSAGARTGVERFDPLLPRPMAVYRAREDAAGADVEFLFKVHGRGTALLAEVLPGQSVRIVGPLGRPFAPAPSGERAFIVAGGTGIASVYGLAARCARAGVEGAVLLGARSAADLMGEDDFAALGFGIEVATEDGSRGRRGLVTELLEAALASPGPARVYACGPTPMMRAAAGIAAAHDVPCVVSLENPMACGFGVCLGCAAPLREGGFALVCRDGPVFDAADIAWAGLP